MRLAIAAALALPFALVACSGGGEAEATKGADAAGGATKGAVAREMAQATQLRPGNYESSMEVVRFEVPGIPEQQQQMIQQMMTSAAAVQNQHCVTEAESQRGARDMFEEMGEGDCQMESFDVAGSRVTGRMVCAAEGRGTTTMTMNGTMEREAANITMTAAVQDSSLPQGRANMEMRVSTRRLGDCTPEQEAAANRQAEQARAAAGAAAGAAAR